MAEKEYIERERLFNALNAYNTKFNAEINSIILSIPKENVQEVIRCKDCNYFCKSKANENGFLICPASGMEITDNDFCSYGEKRSEQE